ncbi:nitrate reductase cytochrome c-type subunit [Mesorhizobium microcysteis]|uniref:Periplasmic nitrate reductase, electron transfer subunit n=2 Tax=Neoaquamicrobium microcysteis TaxID=2682781 RepID=A0A5D4HA70_9HYPH|nr:nitrate reductase cytochrome c-type subunit [Mesorhizobium microcysteis]TYR35680.1 nitrate reductase cytochrome c-type subunit [Mesorhizobium microcysteis]
MRGQDRPRVTRRARLFIAFGLVALAGTAALAQMSAEIVPPLTGAGQAMENLPADPIPRWIVDDIRKMRAYPEQPPIIPHSIEGYQLSVNANRCMSCHKREFTEGSGAPMISVTHYMTREGQMLADVSPRRYFCTACHVPQADTAPLVGNTFVDMSELGVGHAGDQ